MLLDELELELLLELELDELELLDAFEAEIVAALEFDTAKELLLAFSLDAFSALDLLLLSELANFLEDFAAALSAIALLEALAFLFDEAI